MAELATAAASAVASASASAERVIAVSLPSEGEKGTGVLVMTLLLYLVPGTWYICTYVSATGGVQYTSIEQAVQPAVFPCFFTYDTYWRLACVS